MSAVYSCFRPSHSHPENLQKTNLGPHKRQYYSILYLLSGMKRKLSWIYVRGKRARFPALRVEQFFHIGVEGLRFGGIVKMHAAQGIGVIVRIERDSLRPGRNFEQKSLLPGVVLS